MDRPTKVLAARVSHPNFTIYSLDPFLKVRGGCKGSASHYGDEEAGGEDGKLHLDLEGVNFEENVIGRQCSVWICKQSNCS